MGTYAAASLARSGCRRSTSVLNDRLALIVQPDLYRRCCPASRRRWTRFSKNSLRRIDREPRDGAAGIDDRGDVERERPRSPPLDRESDDERADHPTEIPERVHEAGDDTGVIGRDVDGRRPAGAEREIRGREREREQDRFRNRRN